MRNVLLLVHEDAGQEARLQAALSVTRAISGHLTALDVFVIPVIIADPWTGYTDSTLVKTASEDEVSHRAKIEQRLAREDVPWTMLAATGDPALELEDAAELADLIVVNSRGATESMVAERAIVGHVVTKSHRPVLAVPPECTNFDPTSRALVAWNGSNPANEALRAATPLLALSEDVVLLVVNDEEGPCSMEDAAAYLSRHGITARVIDRTTKDPVADVILEQARIGEAGYIVMGAFGHSRAVEAVFGGVTRSVLAESPVPVVLAH
jgi:nucleotide-binding universal stress UspA family protein